MVNMDAIQVRPNQLEAEALKKKRTCGKSRVYSQRGAAEATRALDNDKAGASTGGTAQDLATAAGAAGQSPGNSLVPYGTVAHDRSARDAHGFASGTGADGTLALVSVPLTPAPAPAHDPAARDLEHDGGPHIHAANDAAGDARALDSVARSRARAATPEAKERPPPTPPAATSQQEAQHGLAQHLKPPTAQRGALQRWAPPSAAQRRAPHQALLSAASFYRESAGSPMLALPA
ncbi:hypothetical protein M885DRAFT_623632 [Pelagophyceae sp. CCMP2097]|nr:hypothetical protein M885DRAFT_623632 [Pelagophyceae sp. CCMP2097]